MIFIGIFYCYSLQKQNENKSFRVSEKGRCAFFFLFCSYDTMMHKHLFKYLRSLNCCSFTQSTLIARILCQKLHLEKAPHTQYSIDIHIHSIDDYKFSLKGKLTNSAILFPLIEGNRKGEEERARSIHITWLFLSFLERGGR